MKTKAEAEAVLATLQLDRAVNVADVTSFGRVCRRFTYAAPGGFVEFEVDTDPTPEQLETLAKNLPLPSDKRDEAATKLKTTKAALKRD